MKTKIIGILVCMLLIATTIPAVGILNNDDSYTLLPNDQEEIEAKVFNDIDIKQFEVNPLASSYNTKQSKNTQRSRFPSNENSNILFNPFIAKDADNNRKYTDIKDSHNIPVSHLKFDEASYLLRSKSNQNSTVCGYVNDSETGLHIENVHVSLDWRNQGQYDWNSTYTDMYGFYSMNVAAGEIYLYFWKDGYFSEYIDWFNIGEYETKWINMSLVPYPPETSVICGYVTDVLTSDPIENVEVSLNWRDDQNHYLWNSTYTNSLGFYSGNVAAGQVSLNFYIDGYFNEYVDYFDVDEYETIWVNKSLYPHPPENSIVCGYVTDELTLDPLEDVYVNLNWRDDLGHWNWNSTSTDSLGFYSMNVAAGEVYLDFWKDGYFNDNIDWFEMGEYETIWKNISLLPYLPENSVVCGYVTDGESYDPLENAYVDLGWRDDENHNKWNSTNTNPSGFYSMNVAAGEVYISFWTDGYFYEYFNWFEIGEYVTIWINVSMYPYPPENSVVCGYVTDELTLDPLENAEVSLNWRDDQNHYLWNSTYTNSLGFYSMSVATGQINLNVVADGYLEESTGYYDIGDGEVLWVNISLYSRPAENSMVCGYVTDSDTCLPIVDAPVGLYWHDEEWHQYVNGTSTDFSGYFSMNVAAGEILVITNEDGYAWESTGLVMIEEYQTSWFNFSLIMDDILPTISDVTVPDFVGQYHPGSVTANVSDNTLQQVGILLYDYYNVTFDESLVILYYIDLTGENGTYGIIDYAGLYAELGQDIKSSPTTMILLADQPYQNYGYILADFKKNQTSPWIQVVMEFNLPNRDLNNIALPISLPDGTLELEYISDEIEPGVSIIHSYALLPYGAWVVDPNLNYTLYDIGNPNNPSFNWVPLNNGTYEFQIMATDRAYHSNYTTFNLTILHNPEIPDLDCEGDLSWTDVTPGDTVTGDFEVENIGDPLSELDWEIESYPGWGDWSFDPESGTGLAAGDSVTIDVEVVSPDEYNTEYTGEVTIINSENGSDLCTIPVSLTTRLPIPDLECLGSLSWEDVTPGEIVTSDFMVANVGEPDSELSWEIESYPEWGTWTFVPSSGSGLTPDMGAITVAVEVEAPDDPETEFTGEVKIVNSEDPDDTCTISVSLTTPVNQQLDMHPFLQRISDRFPNAFPILRQLLGL